MKEKTIKLIICILFVLFNVLCLAVYFHIQNKLASHAIFELDSSIFEEIKINEEYQNERIVRFKVNSLDAYGTHLELVNMDYGYKSLINLFNDNSKLVNYLNESSIFESKLTCDLKVYNYMNEIGFQYDGKLNYIEVYDANEIFNTCIDLSDFSSIKKALGKTNVVKIKKTYDYYILGYKMDGIYIQFISFYEDGRKPVCILSNNIIM